MDDRREVYREGRRDDSDRQRPPVDQRGVPDTDARYQVLERKVKDCQNSISEIKEAARQALKDTVKQSEEIARGLRRMEACTNDLQDTIIQLQLKSTKQEKTLEAVVDSMESRFSRLTAAPLSSSSHSPTAEGNRAELQQFISESRRIYATVSDLELEKRKIEELEMVAGEVQRAVAERDDSINLVVAPIFEQVENCQARLGKVEELINSWPSVGTASGTSVSSSSGTGRVDALVSNWPPPSPKK